jgi:oxaloacetate decarboxylase (Na+ extruding) subunit gamma
MGTSLLNQGLMLMLVGMGTVFVFLSVLVLAMNGMSRLLAKLPAPPPPDVPGENREHVAAIAAAVTLHRKSTSKR